MIRAPGYVAAAKRIAALAHQVEVRAADQDPHGKAARTRAINALLRTVRDLQRRNAAG